MSTVGSFKKNVHSRLQTEKIIIDKLISSENVYKTWTGQSISPASRVHQTVNRSVFEPKKPGRCTGQTDRYTDVKLLAGSVGEWYIDRFSYRAGPVTPKIAVYRPVYREMVNPAC
jgi:hypothetical protein